MITSQYPIIGMTCQHCVAAVSDELSTLPGVRAVAVDLVPDGASTATVTSVARLDVATVAVAVGEAGYRLAG